MIVAIIGAGVLWLLGMGVYTALIGNPAIARMKGEVVSVEPVEDHTEICLAHPVDAGSTYGDRSYAELECRNGIIAGVAPEVGECVIIESQGESSVIEVESGRLC